MIDLRRLRRNAVARGADVVRRARGLAAASRGGAADLNRRWVASLSPRRFPTTKQWKYLGTVLSAAERRTLRVAGAVLAFSLVLVGARLWAVHVVRVPVPGGEYVEAVVGAPSLPNPIFVAGNDVDADMVRLMYAGLVTLTADGRLIPDLAESYDISEDGKEYVFRLKERLVWHDGEPLTPDDILFTLSLIQNEAYKSPLAAAFRGVKAERVDDRTVRFALEKPSASFLSAATVGILPAHVWQEVPPAGAQLAEYNIKPIGAGPYRFKALTRDKLGGVRSYVMERFSRAATPALLDRIVLRFYPDMDSATAAVAAKQADGIGFVPLEFRKRLNGRPDLARHTLHLPQYTAVFLNAKRQPLFKDEAIRAALVAATPRERILAEVLKSDAELVEGPLVPGMPGFDASLTQASYDPEAAKAALEKAGWILSSPTSTVREKTKTKKITTGTGKKATTKTVPDGAPVPLAVTLTTVDRPENVATAEMIAEAWRAVGIGVEVATVPAGQLQKDVLYPHAYDALLYGEVLGADPDPYPFWHSSQGADGGFNLSAYTNRAVDDALESARSASSPDARAASYAAFAKQVLADAPAVFLYRPSYPYYVARDVRGVDLDFIATPSDRFAGIRDWYLKTGRAWR